MQNFTELNRKLPERRGSALRIKDYDEIYELFDKNDATAQSTRCIGCGDPYCHNKCPLHNYIPFWLKAIASKDFELAFKLSNETNPFPEITGRICPQDRLCEGDCTLNDFNKEAITIGAIETFISENGFKMGLKPEFPKPRTDKRIAIVGSGPAGISVATYLLRAGFRVDMYEKANRAGGLLTFGIPNFKLDKQVVFRRFEWLKEAGMRLFLNTEVGKDISFEKLEKYDAIFLGIGAEKSKTANLPNENSKGVFKAIEFLTNIQKKHFQDKYDKSFEVKDKNVIVIGGGDTAMDCLRTAIREGAKKVTCLYRRDLLNMPGSRKEFKNARDEGVNFEFNLSPKELIVQDGKIIGVLAQKTKLGQKDKNGRQKLEIIKGVTHKYKADVVIFALGFNNQTPDFLSQNGIETDKWGAIKADLKTMQTTTKGIYTGGDCQRGSDLAVTAAADGKLAAQNIIKNLT